MFCRHCGAPNDENATACARCGVSLRDNAPVNSVPNYLVQAILITVFCCLPFGIVAIVYAAQVNSKLAGGDYQGAVEASQKAKNWSLVGFVCGLVPIGFYILMAIVAVMEGADLN